jgi:hypothetical protein
MPVATTTEDYGVADQILAPAAKKLRYLIADAVACERERCAKIVDRRAKDFAGDGANQLHHLAHCIRNSRYVSGELAE